MKSKATSPERFRAALKKEPNELKRKMMLVGYITDRVARKGGKVFLVGGQAVEAYTGGTFTTGVIDITTTDTPGTEGALVKLGFAKEGMIWLNEGLGMAVHLVADYPGRTPKSRVIEVSGYQVDVVGVEDLVADRLRAAKYWKSGRDLEQAAALLRSFEGELDEPYLSRIAKEDLVEDMLRKIVGKRRRRT